MKRSLLTLGFSPAPACSDRRQLWRGRRRAPRPIRTFRSATATASTPPNSFPTPFPSPIPSTTSCVGVIRLGDPQPGNFSPLYKGQVLVHGMGFSPDHKTIAVVSIGSNSVTFIDTATNAVKHTTYVGRSPHEAFFTPDGKEVWVTVRGEDYVAVLDGQSFEEKSRIKVPAGPGMQIFSPMANTAMSAPRSIRKPSSSPWPIIRSSATSSRTARSARTSPRHPTASRSGSR